MTGKQKRHLRSLAHHLTPLVQVGKAGVTGTLLEQVDVQLEAHELIKVSVSDNSPQDKEEVLQSLLQETDAEFVQSIGRQLVLYRRSTQNPQIELPRP